MLRKTLIALTAVAALGMGSTAMARGGGGHGGGFGGGHGGGGWSGGHGMAAMHGGWGGGRGMGPMHGSLGGRSMAMVPMRGDWGRRSFARNAFVHNRFHRFHRRNAVFFGAAFAGPYDSCLVWTYWGWRNVCGYPYWNY
jgi:hypothetical protein